MLVGPNGAGKSTLFQVISGYLPPDHGTVHLFEAEVTRAAPYARSRLGLGRTFQINALFANLTVQENVCLAMLGCRRGWSTWGQAVDRHILSVARSQLETWELLDWAEIPVRNLAYGLQRQLEILLAICQKPRLLLLDEPTAGLSPKETQNIVHLIQRLPRDITLLVVEHDMDVAFEIADLMSVLHLGQVVATGSPRDLQMDATVQAIYLGTSPAHPLG